MFAEMARRSSERGKVVWFLVHRRELMEQTISTFQKFKIPMDNIYIGMVGKFANHMERYPPPDLIIFDEAHFSAAATWQKIINQFP